MAYQKFEERTDGKANTRVIGRIQVYFGLTILLFLVVLVLLQSPYKQNIYVREYYPPDHLREPPTFRISALFPSTVDSSVSSAVDFLGLDRTVKDRSNSTCQRHFLGTDNLGNDILANLMEGVYILLVYGLWATFISLILGLVGGAIIGYQPGWRAGTGRFLLTTFSAFPPLFLLLLAHIFFGFGPLAIMTAIGIVNSTRLIRVISKKIRFFRNQEFIEALEESGLPHRLILGRHILWNNMRRILVVQTIYAFAGAAMLEISLSFLKYGVKNPRSLGDMIRVGWEEYRNGYPWEFYFPMIVIILALLAIYFLGDGINRRFQLKDEI